MPDKSDIPAATNLILAVAISAILITSLTAMPFFLGSHLWAMVMVTLLLVPLNTPLWSLIHEAIHRNFHPDRSLNEFAGRFLSILFGASFGVLRFGHLMHHQYNREWESEYYEGSKLKAFAAHYFHLLGGLYLIEVMMSYLVALSPAPLIRKIARRLFNDDRHYEAVLNSVLKADNVAKIRTDCLWITFLYTCVFLAFKAAWIVPMIALLGRAVIISVMDNSYHYGTPEDGSVAAKELKTSSLYSRFILNFNFHLTHHKHVALPWSKLAEKHEEEMTPYAQKLGPALLEQFKGPITRR